MRRPHICPKIALINGLNKVYYPPAWTAIGYKQSIPKDGFHNPKQSEVEAI